MRLNWNLWEFPARDDHNPCKRWLCNFHSSVSGGNFLSRIFIEIHFASCMLLKVHFWDVFLSSRSHRLSWIIRVRWALDGALSIIHSMEYLTRVELIDQLETLIKHENEARYSGFRSPVVNFYSSTRYFFYSALLCFAFMNTYEVNWSIAFCMRRSMTSSWSSLVCELST